jgi:hypothetical protein
VDIDVGIVSVCQGPTFFILVHVHVGGWVVVTLAAKGPICTLLWGLLYEDVYVARRSFRLKQTFQFCCNRNLFVLLKIMSKNYVSFRISAAAKHLSLPLPVRPTLKPTHSPMSKGVLSWGQSRQVVILTTHLHLAPKLRISGAIFSYREFFVLSL